MTPNPPIKGHALLREGHFYAVASTLFPSSGGQTRGYRIVGGCQCGAMPGDLYEHNRYVAAGLFQPIDDGMLWFPSANAVKRWHRQHKADLRKQMEDE